MSCNQELWPPSRVCLRPFGQRAHGDSRWIRDLLRSSFESGAATNDGRPALPANVFRDAIFGNDSKPVSERAPVLGLPPPHGPGDPETDRLRRHYRLSDFPELERQSGSRSLLLPGKEFSSSLHRGMEPERPAGIRQRLEVRT